MNQDEWEILLEARKLLDGEEDPANGDQLICECECVSLKEIREYSSGEKVNLQQLKEHFNLGAGCSSCLKNFSSWKNKI